MNKLQENKDRFHKAKKYYKIGINIPPIYIIAESFPEALELSKKEFHNKFEKQFFTSTKYSSFVDVQHGGKAFKDHTREKMEEKIVGRQAYDKYDCSLNDCTGVMVSECRECYDHKIIFNCDECGFSDEQPKIRMRNEM